MNTLNKIDILLKDLQTKEVSSNDIIDALQDIKNSYNNFYYNSDGSRFWKLLPDAISITNSEGIVTDCNDAYLNIYETNSDDVLNKPFYNIFPEEDKENAIASFKDIFKVGELDLSYETWVVTAKGNRRYVQSNPTFVFSDSNEKFLLSSIRDITSQKEYQLALEDITEKYKLVTGATGTGTWITDLGGGLLSANDTFSKILGLPAGSNEINTEEFINLVHHDNKDAIKEFFSINSYKNKQYFDKEIRIINTVNNEYIWIRFIGKIINLDENSLPSKIAGIILDINDAKIQEIELNKTNNTLVFLLETIPIIIWKGDNNGNVTYMNQYGLTYLGANSDDLNSNDWVGYTHENDRNILNNKWLNSLQTGESFSNVQRMKAADGTFKWFNVKAFKSEYLNETMWFAFALDINEIYELNKKVEYIVNNSHELISVYSDFNLVFSTPNVNFFKDNTTTEYNLNDIANISHNEDKDRLYNLTEDWKQSKKPFLKQNIRILKSDNEYIWVEINISSHFNSDKEYISVCVIRNINESKLYAKKLEESERFNTRIISLISHDLTNSIGAVMGLTNYLVEEIDESMNKETRYTLENINKSIISSYELLNNILLWTKNNNYAASVSAFNLSNIITKIETFFEAKLKDKNLSIKSTLPKNFLVKSDSVILEAILRNLISNAIKFSNDNGVIEIDYAKLSKTSYKLIITDYGIGLKPEYLKIILNKNTDRRNILNSTNKGSGLGLSLVLDFLELIDATIKVESTENEYTKFIMIFDNYAG